jgi:phospholipase/carboxylesterase
MDRSLVILLHGVHADGANLAPLADRLRLALPGAEIVAPNAPFETPIGWQWFSLDGVTPENRQQRVAAARAPFDALLRNIIDAHGFRNDPRRIALVGFSQGSIMALDAIASGRWPVTGVVAFSGRFASPPPLAPAVRTPMLLIHGDDDSVIPWTESRSAAETLEKLGASTQLHVLHGVDHCISPEGADLAAAFLARVLNDAGETV